MTDHIGDCQRKTTANDIANQRPTLWRPGKGSGNNPVITKARSIATTATGTLHDAVGAPSLADSADALKQRTDYCELLARPPSPSTRERISRSHWASRMRFT